MAVYLPHFSFTKLADIVQSLIENAEGFYPLWVVNNDAASIEQIDKDESLNHKFCVIWNCGHTRSASSTASVPQKQDI